MLENYEGTAIDTADFVELDEAEVQPVDEPAQTGADDTVGPQDDEGASAIDTAAPEKINIPGFGEFTVDEVKEWKNGSLRQSDYTRKTQELARQREEAKDAVDLFNYLRANPHIVSAMQQAEQNPSSAVHLAPTRDNDMLRQLAYNQKAMETDMKVNALKQKYGEIDEIALYNKAAELRTDDLEFVYKALSYDGRQVDKDSLIKEAKEQLMAELQADKASVSTFVSSKQTAPVQVQVALTADEKRVAAGMGLTEKEYIKWMNN